MQKSILSFLSLFFIQMILVAQPTITEFFPSNGPVGTLVTINGTQLNDLTLFTIGGTEAVLVSNTGTQLVGMVKPGTATGNISISTSGGLVNSNSNFLVTATPFPDHQLGSKIVAPDASNPEQQGSSIGISKDGNTAVVGGVSGVWVFRRSGGIWVQDGPVIPAGTNNFTPPTASISGDGNTIIIGDPIDNNGLGSIRIFIFSSGLWLQQGNKLIGSQACCNAGQGTSVSLSYDGNTAIVGGPGDSNNFGAAWIFVRSGNTWAQQGNKLIGTGSGTLPYQGISVALSGDGNTAIVGGSNDYTGTGSTGGAAWVYTRIGNTWAQQGSKLKGIDIDYAAQLGAAASLSEDGNTAIIGAPGDNFGYGATLVFTRVGNSWVQHGNKLIGSGATNYVNQGNAIDLSADGNTLMIGSYQDNFGAGATWIFTRNGNLWTQQGGKIFGTGGIGNGLMAKSVSISGDGSIALAGAPSDNSSKGAFWTFAHTNGIWSQLGSKSVGIGNTGAAAQGSSVAISADGNTMAVGGPSDIGSVGATWVYVRNGNTWVQQGPKLVGTNAFESRFQGSSVAISADGNTVLIGSSYPSSSYQQQGAGAWVFTRLGAVWSQQGEQLVPSGPRNSSSSSAKVALSADGNTAILGDEYSNGSWVFVRNGTTWSQDGVKLVGSGGVGSNLNQGSAVALSADGITAIIGASSDNNSLGASWVFTRSGGSWVQQGTKLVGTGTVIGSSTYQGAAVALSADGNTAMVGGPGDRNGTGASWIFTRSAGIWTQQGNKLVETTSFFGRERLGSTVSFSADGNSAAVGFFSSFTNSSSSVVFTRSAGVWSQSAVLTPTGGASPPLYTQVQRLYPAAISSDGKTAVLGASQDDNGKGAVWIFRAPGSLVNADPALGGIYITDTLGTNINANTVLFDSIVRIHLPVFNLSQDSAVFAGSTTLQVNMGRKFGLDPDFPIASFPLSNYFTWSASEVNGELIISGDQIAVLPPDFVDTAEFTLKADSSCSSSIDASFIVDNHSSIDVLVDDDATNNISTLNYSIDVPAPQPGDQSVCSNLSPTQTLTATAVATGGGTISWFDAATLGNLVTNPILTGVGTVTYYAQTTNGTCTGNIRRAVILEIKPPPATPSITWVNNGNGTFTLTANGFTGTLLWNNGQTSPVITVSVADVYTVTQTVNGCTSAAGSASVSVPVVFADPALGGHYITDTLGANISANSIPFDSIVKVNLPVFNRSQDFPVTAGATTLRINMGRKFRIDPAFPVSSFPLNSYFTWTSSEVNGELIISGAQIANLPADFADMVVFTLKADSSCSSIIRSSFIIDNRSFLYFFFDDDENNNASTLTYTVNVPAPSTINESVCSDGNATQTLTASAVATGGGSISWFDAATGGNTVANPILTGVGTATYYAQTTNGTCAGNVRTTVSLEIKPVPPAPAAASVSNGNGTFTLTANGFTGTLLWSTGQTSATIIVSYEGTYSVTQTLNGCISAAASITISFSAAPADPAVSQMYFTKTSGATQDANNLLMEPSPDLYDINIPFYNSNQLSPVPNGTISFQVSLGSKLVLASGFNLATAPLSSYFSWAQSIIDGNAVLTGTQIAEIPADFNGIAGFRVKGDSACRSKVVSDIIVTNPSAFSDEDLQNNNATLQYNFPVTLAHTRVNVTCNGAANGIINITASSGTSITTTGPAGYSNTTGLAAGANNFTLNNLEPGAYTVTAAATSDASLAACSQTISVIISQPPLLTLTVSAFENNACHNGISGSISVVAYGGVPPYNYGIIGPTVNNTGVSTGIFTGLAAGDYTITVTDNNGCIVSATASLSEPNGTAPDISLGSDVSGTLFAAEGVTQTIVYNISEIAGNVAVGDTLRINKVSGFTIGINPTLLDTILGGTTYTLSNPMWKIENSNPSFISIIFTDMLNVLNPGILQCNQRVNVAITLTRNTSDISVFTLSARLRKVNGEINLSNNLNSVIFAAQ